MNTKKHYESSRRSLVWRGTLPTNCDTHWNKIHSSKICTKPLQIKSMPQFQTNATHLFENYGNKSLEELQTFMEQVRHMSSEQYKPVATIFTEIDNFATIWNDKCALDISPKINMVHFCSNKYFLAGHSQMGIYIMVKLL